MEKNISATDRELAFDFEEGCKMVVDRVPGTKGYDCNIMATTAVAALKGLSLLTVKLAEIVGCSVEEVLCKLAVVLLAPDEMPEGEEYGSEEG